MHIQDIPVEWYLSNEDEELSNRLEIIPTSLQEGQIYPSVIGAYYP